MSAATIIQTERLILRTWNDRDCDEFCKLHSDANVMHDLGGPITREQSVQKLNQYREVYERVGYTRWCVTDRSGEFLGYVGVMRRGSEHPIGEHDEIGWRLRRDAWGQGYATEAAIAALKDCFASHALPVILAYTSASNARSVSVISRLLFERCPSLDFTSERRQALVWRANSTTPRLR